MFVLFMQYFCVCNVHIIYFAIIVFSVILFLKTSLIGLFAGATMRSLHKLSFHHLSPSAAILIILKLGRRKQLQLYGDHTFLESKL